MDLKSLIRDVPDFPQEGILFRDMTPLLQNPKALDFVSQNLVRDVDLSQIDFFAGIESRGFILASHLAATHHKGFLPIRKAGKLPPPTKKISYALEYGTAEIELPLGSGRIMIVDDVLATGGTLQAAIDLSSSAGYKVEAVAVLVNLKFLNKMKFNNKEVFSLVQY
ncbi:adenine phosphoribosyltransferase [Bdellovibrio svalbardensis]|uniref:Adenine phosphoribosyltransferase n=1 Tax=Bdellovibrio svalbardensis TaxID=2972972 RepID=A0ABT6DLR0_9BACT|nr:adenine phosphoribosyltransferase [Bdellovibrio svalbardensis]MDG0816751.1 adenine phosphoribosyltransferase [Bdellovibrio svalbardensis]